MTQAHEARFVAAELEDVDEQRALQRLAPFDRGAADDPHGVGVARRKLPQECQGRGRQVGDARRRGVQRAERDAR